MAVSPDPRTLMQPDPDEVSPFLSNKLLPGVATALGLVNVLIRRGIRRRPLLSGIQEHIIWTAAGFVVGSFLQNRYENYQSVRDAVIRHYIELHPEDFPAPERKTFGEIFGKWTPIR